MCLQINEYILPGLMFEGRYGIHAIYVLVPLVVFLSFYGAVDVAIVLIVYSVLAMCVHLAANAPRRSV